MLFLQYLFLFFRLYSILKDYCGTVTEDSVQANNLLILEILNEFAVGEFYNLYTSLKIDCFTEVFFL